MSDQTCVLNSLSVGALFHYADGLDNDAEFLNEVVENNEVRVLVHSFIEAWRFHPMQTVDGLTVVRPVR